MRTSARCKRMSPNHIEQVAPVSKSGTWATHSYSTSTQSKSGTVVLVVTRSAESTPVNDWRMIFPVVSYASSVKVPEKWSQSGPTVTVSVM
jgi:hypothetical protein